MNFKISNFLSPLLHLFISQRDKELLKGEKYVFLPKFIFLILPKLSKIYTIFTAQGQSIDLVSILFKDSGTKKNRSKKQKINKIHFILVFWTEGRRSYWMTWKWKSLSCVWLSMTPWTIQSLEFSSPEYRREQLFPSPGYLPNQGSNPCLLHCRQVLYQLSHQRSPKILEWVAYSFSRRSSWPRNQTGVSCIAGELLPAELPGKPKQGNYIMGILWITWRENYKS